MHCGTCVRLTDPGILSKVDGRSWIFIGGRRHGLELLKRLLAAGESPRLAYILEEDRHEQERRCSEIAELCTAHSIPHRITKKVGASSVVEISTLEPDLIAVMGWRSIIPPEILRIPRFGCVNLHDALLPAYRGFAPINWAIINGESRTGVSLFYLDEGMDSGPIIAQRQITIGPNDTAADVYARVTRASVDLMAEYVPMLVRSKLPAEPQDEAAATYTCSRSPEDGLIDWSARTRQIYDLVRALAYPYPGAFTVLDTARLTIWKARPVESSRHYVGRIPGRVVALKPDGVEVLTGDGILHLERVQLEGREPQAAQDVLRSVRATLGRMPWAKHSSASGARG